MNPEVVVVGGGPAGASCAYHLSKSGLNVLLLEKEKLPRFKLCAGCLSARTLGLLPESRKGLFLNTIRSGRLGFMGIEEVRVDAREEVAYIVDRRFFDLFLVEKAQEAGAELLQAEFIGFEKEESGYRVFTSKGDFFADFLVGADGVHSKTARILGFKKKGVYKSLEFLTGGHMKEEVLIEIGLVSRGYLWVFPHGEGISVGVASAGKEDLTRILKDYADKKGIKYTHPKGWHIPCPEGEGDIHTGRDRALLVGDSANMADPLLGEGIYYALWAGRLVSEAIVKNPSNPADTYRKLLKPLVDELLYAGKIARLAYRFQRLAYKMGKEFALASFYELLAGERSYKSLYWKGWLNFLKNLTVERLMGIFRGHEGRSVGATPWL
ncbi:MAG: geranylgeranyl reductase family protein [Aquificaceae bacterium]|nr:geranylgeranyl reductase family protein [Aquificaceae bacterium]